MANWVKTTKTKNQHQIHSVLLSCIATFLLWGLQLLLLNYLCCLTSVCSCLYAAWAATRMCTWVKKINKKFPKKYEMHNGSSCGSVQWRPRQSLVRLCLCVCVYGRKEEKQQGTGDRSFLSAACSAARLAVYPSALPLGRHKQFVFQLVSNHWKMGLALAKDNQWLDGARLLERHLESQPSGTFFSHNLCLHSRLSVQKVSWYNLLISIQSECINVPKRIEEDRKSTRQVSASSSQVAVFGSFLWKVEQNIQDATTVV